MKANTPSTDNAADYCDIDEAMFYAEQLILKGWDRRLAIERACEKFSVTSPCRHLVEASLPAVSQDII